IAFIYVERFGKGDRIGDDCNFQVMPIIRGRANGRSPLHIQNAKHTICGSAIAFTYRKFRSGDRIIGDKYLDDDQL
ncbi:MAG: hypothetical protein HC764_14970, partial [Pleurocapsa sp. CRU_1_2]|nr:hypothetical protein [Pleurocapsa sp. CRU_1_2]